MQVSVEELGGLGRRMTVELPAERVEAEIDKRLRNMSRRVRMDGFRPGKVPMKVVRRRYGGSVRHEVVSELLESSYREALGEQKLRPAGPPHIHADPPLEGQNLRFSAEFEVYPEFEVQGAEGISLVRPVASVTDADIDNMIETLRKQRSEWQEVERPAADGDQVHVDFIGRIDGEAFDGGTGEDVPVRIGTKSFIAGFEEGLIGLSAGGEKVLELSFPEDYQNTNLAGKQVSFEVKVRKVEEPRLPEVNDTFVASFGVQEGGVEALRSELRKNMERELGQAVRGRVKEQVMSALLEANPVDVPAALVDGELRHLAEQSGARAPDQEQPLEITDQIRERFEEPARKRVALGLIVGELVRAHNIEVDKDRMEAHIQSLCSTYEDPEAVARWYRESAQAQQLLRGQVLEDQVVDWVVDRGEVSEEALSFDDVIKN